MTEACLGAMQVTKVAQGIFRISQPGQDLMEMFEMEIEQNCRSQLEKLEWI
jgi:hypothetical protein